MGSCFSINNSSNRSQQRSSNAKDNFNGPIKGRSCTDCPFLVLFIFVFISLVGLVVYCAIHGDVKRFFYGYDECGNICGFKNEKSSDPKVCTGIYDVSGEPFLWINASIYKAADLKNVERKCVKNCSSNEKEFLHRCVSNGNKIINHALQNVSLDNIFPEVMQDLLYTKWDIIHLCLFALVSSLLIVFMVKFVAGIVVWSVLFGVIMVSFSASIYLWITWKQKSNQAFEEKIPGKDVNTYFVLALIATISTIIIVIIIVAMRKRIALVIQLFKESGKAIQSMPLLLIQPMVTFFFLCLAVIVWILFVVFIQSSGFPGFESNPKHIYYKKDQLMKFARIYNIMIFFWVIEFIIACQHMIISGSVATWFFTRNKDNLSSPISTSIGYLFKYHLGSVALGSLIITILKIVRFILNFIHNCLKKSENAVAKIVYGIFKYAFNYVIELIKYLTRNAFIEIAIYGDNFCSSGQQAFETITSNTLRVAAINSVGDFVLFLMKVLVVFMTVFLGFLMLQNKQEISNLWVPISVAGLFAYFVAHCFISVYEMVIDTIFLCFCEDCNMHDNGTQEYYMSKELMDFIDTSHKVLSAGDGATN